jgi:hypothetical protein
MVLMIQVFWEVKQTNMQITFLHLLDPEDVLPNNTLVISFSKEYAGTSKNISPVSAHAPHH